MLTIKDIEKLKTHLEHTQQEMDGTWRIVPPTEFEKTVAHLEQYSRSMSKEQLIKAVIYCYLRHCSGTTITDDNSVK